MPMPDPRGRWSFGGVTVERSAAWLLALDPVDLFRLAALVSATPDVGTSERADTGGAAAVGDAGASSTLPLAVGWAAWLVFPTLVGVRRFRSLPLR